MKKIITRISTLLGAAGVEETAERLGISKATAYNLNAERAGKSLQQAYQRIYEFLLSMEFEKRQQFYPVLTAKTVSLEKQLNRLQYLHSSLIKTQSLREKTFLMIADFSLKIQKLDNQIFWIKDEIQTLEKKIN